MEGKCVLFKTFGVDAIACIRSKDVDEIVRTIRLISGSFGRINLEDISLRCFEIEEAEGNARHPLHATSTARL